jgi:hypothetical protein
VLVFLVKIADSSSREAASSELVYVVLAGEWPCVVT